jgi:hypothetical protein
VSVEGNRKKTNNIYSLDMLNPNYLKAQFGTTNIVEIRKTIEETLNIYIEDKTVFFDRLKPEEQRNLRHALFIKELRSDCIKLLNTGSKTRVNGTQSYLVKQIKTFLITEGKKLFPNVTLAISTTAVKSDDTQTLRRIFTKFYPEFTKGKPQGFISHVIDASMSLAHFIESKKDFPLFFDGEDVPKMEQSERFRFLIPDSFSVLKIERKPKYNREIHNVKHSKLFKDGLYQERFLPVLVCKKGIQFGFSLDNSTEPIIEPNKVFEALKSFLVYKGKPVSNSLDELLSSLKKDTSFLYITVDKQKAITWIHSLHRKSDVSKEDLFLYKVLSILYYTVKKVDILGTLFDQKGLKKSLEDKNFELNIKDDFKSDKLEKVKILSQNKELVHPCKAEWLKVLEHPEIQKHPDQTKVNDVNMEQVWKDLFPSTKPDRYHKAVRTGSRLVVSEHGKTIKEYPLNKIKTITVSQQGVSFSSNLLLNCSVRGIK